MLLDFASPPQVRAGLNVVFHALKSIADPTILPNACLARPIHVTPEEGSLLRCGHPAAVDGRITTCP